METKIVDGVEVMFTPGYSQWDMAGDTWHINWQLGEKKKGKEVFHVTKEARPKLHYFFTLDAGVIDDATSPTKAKKGTAFKFSALPGEVQSFVRDNIDALGG